MCNLSDGVEQKGIEQGTLITLCGLVRDGLLTVEDAAKRLEMSIEDFQEKVLQLS